LNWIIEEKAFNAEGIAANGNKFMIGNGYMGYSQPISATPSMLTAIF